MASKKNKLKVSPPRTFNVEGVANAVVECCVCTHTDTDVAIVIKAPFLNDAKAVLHWGRSESEVGEWSQPDDLLPPDTVAVGDGKAGQSAFTGNECVLRFANPNTSDNVTLPPVPPSIQFVIKQAESNENGERWWKQEGGCNFSYLPLPSKTTGTETSADMLAKMFCQPEATSHNWSQFQRYCLCMDAVGHRPLGFDRVSWVTTILRLSKLRMLDWFRNYNYQPKDFTHVQERLAVSLTDAYNAPGTDCSSKGLLRLCMGFVPRGGSSSGDAIRMTILNIMRNHGIKEGHRPGIEDRFLEQWHQKLHTNSAPDDIQICEGYIRFLETHNVTDFWNYLEKNAFLSRKKLSMMPHPITADPLHLPQLKQSMHDFLGLLKSVHSGADLDYMAECCKQQIPHNAECAVWDILSNRHEWWAPGRINEARKQLSGEIWKRDVLMLDWALENWQLTKLGSTDPSSVDENGALNVVEVLLESMRLSRRSARVDAAAGFFAKVKSMRKDNEWSSEWCKLMLSALDRICVICTSSVDLISSTLQENAKLVAEAIQKGDKALERFGFESVAAFGEETARSLPELHLSRFSRRVMSKLRSHVGAGPWDIVSNPRKNLPVVGKPVMVESLEMLPAEIIGTSPHPKVVCCLKITGWEDIPAGVAAIVIPPGQSVDVLSHLAIRARTQEVLLACCENDELWQAQILGHFEVGKSNYVSLSVNSKDEFMIETTTLSAPVSRVQSTVETVTPSASNDIAVSPATTTSTPFKGESTSQTGTTAKTTANGTEKSVDNKSIPRPPKLILNVEELSKFEQSVGKKSFNLSQLSRISAGNESDGAFERPSSFVLPFGVFENELSEDANSSLSEYIQDTVSSIENTKSKIEPSKLQKLRDAVIEDLVVSPQLEKNLNDVVRSFREGASVEGVDEIFATIRRVWASKWNDRAVSCRLRNGISDNKLLMGVLVQNLIEADYAFVVHTHNPISDNPHLESFIEVVCGLGEPLVSNCPGKPLSAVAKKCEPPNSDSESVSFQVLSFPSKDSVYRSAHGGTLICRSDSNGEDLPGFAGAGLYDSFPIRDNNIVTADYTSEPLVFDAEFRKRILTRLYQVGQQILRQCHNVPQDVEGCIKGEKVFVVQTRPQII